MRNILFNSRQVQREMKALVRQVFYASGCEEVIPERVLGEGKRRTTMVPHFPIESSGLRLLYASLINHSFKRARGDEDDTRYPARVGGTAQGSFGAIGPESWKGRNTSTESRPTEALAPLVRQGLQRKLETGMVNHMW
jgi:hypothetical protein